jgi:AraC-like DNA-binding protein/ligand-binding sensor protein
MFSTRMNRDQLSGIVEELRQSRAYQDYCLAFAEALKLPLELSAVNENGQAVDHSNPLNPFCTILAGTNKICASCPQIHLPESHPKISEIRTIRCFFGLTITIVPVKLDNQVIGFLKTGVFLSNPDPEIFLNIAAQLIRFRVEVNLSRLEHAYFDSRAVSPDFYQAVVRLLETIAHHLNTIADEIAVERCNQDPPLVKRGKDYIARHLSDRIRLGDIARALNMSPFHFCRTFKQFTGRTFVEYLSHVRVERAKILLRDRGLRVSEVAYEVGFQTLTHFNRTFRKLVGCSPTDYRSQDPWRTPNQRGKVG